MAGYPAYLALSEFEPFAFIPPSQIEGQYNRFWKNEKVTSQEDKQPEQPKKLEDFVMFSKESTNTSNEYLDETDTEEYEKPCPSFCPSRDVMVCAKCQHGIYKTFLSTCHMRMFTCNHEHEVLELISRYPCVLSAPYIHEDIMKTKGRKREASDDDVILRYLICKETGGLTKDANGKALDPRCNFEASVMDKNIEILIAFENYVGPYLYKKTGDSEY